MPNRKTHTEQGEVEYETAICSSCGEEIAKQNAVNVVVGDLDNEKHWSFGKHEYHFKDGRPDVGWLCEHCHETPAAYPHKRDSTGGKGRFWHLAKVIKG